MVVVMRKEECVTGDVEHGIITPHRFRVLSRSSHMRHILCVCRSSGRVSYFSFWGVCRSTYILNVGRPRSMSSPILGPDRAQLWPYHELPRPSAGNMMLFEGDSQIFISSSIVIYPGL